MDITASVGSISGSLSVRVTGETTTTAGNNISWPIIFGEGVPPDMVLRPASTELAAYAEFQLATATDPTAIFFYTGNTTDATYAGYYLQGTATNTWRAQIVDGTGHAKYALDAAWGDNLAGTESGGEDGTSEEGGNGGLTVGHPIRIEVALSATGVGSLNGFKMYPLQFESSPDEIQGTKNEQVALVPLFYTSSFAFSIQGADGTVDLPKAMAAETNVAGRLVYGAQFTPTAAGEYTLIFKLGDGANATITSSTNGVVDNATQSSITITVNP